METHKSFCRMCHANCAVEVDTEDGKLMAVRGDRDDPLFRGYTCLKGRQAADQIDHPDRLRTSVKRQADGRFTPVASETALDEIAARITRIIEQYGPDAVATYNGTYGFSTNGAWDGAQGLHLATGSASYFTSATVDQPAKFSVAPSRHGMWAAGLQDFDGSDVGIYIGNNPTISHYTGGYGGVPPFSPARRMKDAQLRGFKLIVIDPRRTELARRADIFLQIKPGEDPTLLCGLLKVVLDEGIHDKEFCEKYTTGLEELRAAINDFSPEYVEQRAQVPAHLLVEAARVFGRGPRGIALAGTGPNMAPRAPLTEHLITCLNTVCGRYKRVGEKIGNINLMRPSGSKRAQVVPPWDVYGGNKPGPIRGLRPMAGHRTSTLLEFPASALADKILTPGEGKIRALISTAGNPLVALPNQRKMRKALENLDLLVQIDIKMSATARLADYVIAVKTGYERAELNYPMGAMMPAPYAAYTDALVPSVGDVVEEWEFFWGLLRRMNLALTFPGGGTLPMDRKPSKDEVFLALCPNMLVSLERLKTMKGGRIYEEFYAEVLPAEPGNNARLCMTPAGIPEEIRELRAERYSPNGDYTGDLKHFTHRLISRRLPNCYNSSLRDLPKLQKKGTTNPAFMNPGDMGHLGIESGDLVEITSALAKIPAVAQASDEIRPGVISFSHCWGDLPEFDPRLRELGSSVNRLIDDENHFDAWTGMGIQSGIPVNVSLLVNAAQPDKTTVTESEGLPA